MQVDCAVIGGGIAGMQAAIQLGRYQHSVVVIDAGDGRSRKCRNYHNLLGFPDGVSGSELLLQGRRHAEQLGVSFIKAKVTGASKDREGFKLDIEGVETVHAKRLLFATGVKDRLPDFPKLYPCLGISIYICPDCDGYEIRDKRVLVLGSGRAGASMALELTHWTEDIVYINHEQQQVPEEQLDRLLQIGIGYIEKPIRQLVTEGDHLKGAILRDGSVIAGENAFVAFGGNEVRSELASQLGVKLSASKHIVTDARTKMTNIQHVWAAGDIAVHSEQVAIAMGDGVQAAIWMHKSLVEDIGSGSRFGR
ncbi:pyridine nucleotide-disulfide oxidoreductase [Paenibacillus sambharensis]|uniref:Pyridine nucleotide-disulfide oxidoreductase n=1 Tax=Paenibacillus sambharensis TaxID=1803190 RepID=A0A2W1M231_9BACL|nr:NAD(P)/FAD-dependent oxidoreductase [Paenibacillus sambharensis]PZD97697.1 pyridine nucleotide-disulfide oxidoreductase [Paenibacillus sambharensis]